MTGWKRICCAVEFEETSRVAMEEAADLARRFEAELTLVHVVASPAATASDVLVSSRTVLGTEAAEDEDRLARWRADLEARSGRPVRARMMSGDPVAEVARIARDERCDLVVVGTHGRTGIPRLFRRSVSEAIARRSPCDVLVVHDHLALDAAIAEEVAQYR